MEKINYPLVYFNLGQDAVLGILIGAELQVVDKDLKSVKATLSTHLQRQYKKFDDYPYMSMVKPRLRVFNIEIRPTYREKTGAYPQSTTLKVPVVAVYGENQNNYYECYLPLMEESFYYYDEKEFLALTSHFATNYFNKLSPEDIYRHLLYQKPQLDEVFA